MEKSVSSNLQKRYDVAKRRFNDIKNGYLINGYYYNLKSIVKKYAMNWAEPEWGFPKGRRNSNENNIETAIREFSEETGYTLNDITLFKYPIFNELFIGSDNMKYKHTYYLAELKTENHNPTLDNTNKVQALEISDIGFFTLNECLNDKIRFYLHEKKRVIQKVYSYIQRSYVL